MIYNLYCSKDRDYNYHSVLDDEKEDIQTIKCLSCGHTQENKILEKRVTVEKNIYEEFQKHAK